MSPTTVGIICFIALIIIMLNLRIPIGIAMSMVGFAGLIYLEGIDAAFGVLRTVPFRTSASYFLSVVPLFVLMGEVAFRAGMTQELYGAAYKWLGRFPGGLAMATTAACAGFGAVCGSSQAGAATMGRIAIPEMRKYEYADSLASASVAAGGTLAILIPPSIGFILYAMLTQESLGKLFIAGIFPGIILTILFILSIFFVARRNPKLAPSGNSFSVKEMVLGTRGIWPVVIVFAFVMIGIYIGIFSATEAGAVGAFAVYVISLARRRLSFKDSLGVLVSTGRVTGMFMLIFTGAMIFMYFLSVTRLPFEVIDLIAGLSLSPYYIFAAVVLLYVALGFIMDLLSIIIITIPIIHPVIVSLGFDPIWFGVIVTITGEMGLITPPFGQNVFVLSGMFDDLPVWTIYRGVFPFVAAMALCIIILTLFPQIATFLPSLM